MTSPRRFALLFALALVAPARTARGDDPPPAPPPGEPPPDAAKPDEDAPDKTRGYVGYTPRIVQTLLEEERNAIGLKKEKETGFVVQGVLPRSPAEKAGLKRGDILLKINGEDLPDTKGVDPKNEEALKKFWKETWEPRTKKVKPGDTVTILVERAEKKVEIKAVAITWDAYAALVELDKEDQMSVPVPDPAEAGAAEAVKQDFEKVPDGEVMPTGFIAVWGTWETF